MPPASLHRRRGTSGRRNRAGGIVRLVLIGALLMVLAFVCMWISMAMFVTNGAAGSTGGHLQEDLRHKVQAVPELLRGARQRFLHHQQANKNEPDADAPEADVEEESPEDDDDTVKKLKAAAAADGAVNDPPAAAIKEYPYPLDEVPATYDIASQYQVKGGMRFIEYTTGAPPSYVINDALRERSDRVARSRRPFVKAAMQHAWSNYVKFAFGADELLPQSSRGSNNWGGQGITLVDALDTLWLMNMKDEFWQARDWVREHLDHSTVNSLVSVFETTIRDLGGLLAAYDWSGDKVFLDKAHDLGTRLLKSYDGSPTKLPYGMVNLQDGSQHANLGWANGNVIIAEVGTTQLENRYLTRRTGDSSFATKTEHVFDILLELARPNGLYPYFLRNEPGKDAGKLQDGSPRPEFDNSKLTFGAMSDSLYEYMLKIWLQGGKTEPKYRAMYNKAMDGMHAELLQKSTPSRLTYIADKDERNGVMDQKMDHLVCFMGGLLALGAYTDPDGLDGWRAQRDLQTGRALTYTCYQMYARMATGISPEFVQFQDGHDFVIGRGAPHYLLRPEAVESFFVLHQLTGDPIYREWGWEVFQSIEKYCKTNVGYGSLSNVMDTNGKPRDKMESFFLAETLKYLYLLMDPDTEVDILHKHVFNTEAHPLRIFPVLDQTGVAAVKA